MNCYSRGSILAPIIIIGEGPGAKEVGHKLNASKNMDATSAPIPFCGPSGQLMQQILQWAGIEEGDYIMTNVVTFFPQENGRTRRPTESEIEEEITRLIKEIQVIRPRLIVSVGKTAYWALAKKNEVNIDEIRISDVNGKATKITFEGRNNEEEFSVSILPIFHPAFVLRASDEKKAEIKAAIGSAFVRNNELISKAVGRPLLIQ